MSGLGKGIVASSVAKLLQADRIKGYLHENRSLCEL